MGFGVQFNESEENVIWIRKTLNCRTVGDVKQHISTNPDLEDKMSKRKLKNIPIHKQIVVQKTEEGGMLLLGDETPLASIEKINGIKLHLYKKPAPGPTTVNLEGLVNNLPTQKEVDSSLTIGELKLHIQFVTHILPSRQKLTTMGRLVYYDHERIRDYMISATHNPTFHVAVEDNPAEASGANDEDDEQEPEE